MTKGDLVEIIWRDTHVAATPGWLTVQDHAEWCKDCGDVVKSCGYYVGECKDFYQLVGDMDDKPDDPYYLRPINIAKGFIKKIRVVRKAK